MCRVGHNHIYTVYVRCFWQGNDQIYSHIRCIYTVLASPSDVVMLALSCYLQKKLCISRTEPIIVVWVRKRKVAAPVPRGTQFG